MPQFATQEGADAQLSGTLAGLLAGTYLDIWLYSGSSSFSSTISLGDLVPYWTWTGNLLNISAPDWSFSAADGDVTASLSDQTFTISSPAPGFTYDGWVVTGANPSNGQPDYALLWCGTISPTFTPGPPGPETYVLSGLTVTLGQCGTSPPPPPSDGLLHLDLWAGSGTVGLTSYTPDYGPAWTIRQGSPVVYGSELHAGTGLLPSILVDLSTPQYTVTITFTPGVSDDLYVFPRYSGPNDQWYIIVDHLGLLHLGVVVGGVATNLTNTAITVVAGTTYTLVVTASGSALYAELLGQPSAYYGAYATGLSADSFGLYFSNSGGSTTMTLSYFRAITP